jgi:hypothetical protein
MTITTQILLGAALLGICLVLHVLILIAAVNGLRAARQSAVGPISDMRWGMHVGGVLAILIGGHTVQVWMWAVALVLLGGLASIDEAIYFALVTYTTRGYGEVVLAPAFRVFGAMAAVTGLLAFGLSTAALVGFVTKMLRWESS